MLVALVGIDLAGKSTQVERLSAHYKNVGRSVFTVRLNDKPTVETVTELSLLLDPNPATFPFGLAPDYFATAYNVDFLNHHRRNIAPLLKGGHLVISDRYVACYKAYAYAVDAKSPLNYSFLDILPAADLAIYLKISVEEAFKRMASRSTPRSIDETPVILSRLHDSYETLAQEFHFPVVNGERPEHEVTKEIVSLIDNRYE